MGINSQAEAEIRELKEEAKLREELETAWLRGWAYGVRAPDSELEPDLVQREAADYAERVVGGSTRAERPEVER